MDTVQDQASARLYKKLFALRKTLPTDEGAVFDQIIPAEDEVQGHRLAHRRTKAKTKAAPEVTGHKMTKTKTKKGATTAAKKKVAK
jgi:hypothetical protein